MSSNTYKGIKFVSINFILLSFIAINFVQLEAKSTQWTVLVYCVLGGSLLLENWIL